MKKDNRYILHVMGMDSTKYGGIERFNIALSQALLDRGYHSIFIYESFPESDSFVKDLQRNHAQIVVSNARKHPLRFCIDLVKIIQHYRPVLIHAHFTKARFYAIPIARVLGVKKLFFTIHSEMDRKEQIKPITRLWYGYANRIANVIAVSENIVSVYHSNWPSASVRRIYLGVDSVTATRIKSREALGIPETQFMVLTVANFSQIKGLDILVKAVSGLKNSGVWDDHARLYIVGQPDDDISDLEPLVISLGIEKEVLMVGISDKVAQYMAAADLYIQPSRSEGLPLALMEAASCSLPLIGSYVGGIPEIIFDGQNGFLVAPENEAQLMKAIESIVRNPELRIKFGTNSRHLYEDRFNLEKGINQTIGYFGLDQLRV